MIIITDFIQFQDSNKSFCSSIKVNGKEYAIATKKYESIDDCKEACINRVLEEVEAILRDKMRAPD